MELLAAWTAANLEHIRRHHRHLVADHRGPLDRYVIGRIVYRVGRAVGVPRVQAELQWLHHSADPVNARYLLCSVALWGKLRATRSRVPCVTWDAIIRLHQAGR